ncbi:putative ferrochelatase [Luteitalea sp. TBR-22]|uniref:ferrochelatase n=1 Tax=Luteitalea sp. TBR-22 TaxID=2802971 RepID=UPI001AF09BE9|nr:ferrochelatase [Luteitalea sp. TBR-22]BCS33569.1 putative ferrochelatase [Luteitalea sp. TBR-22]
MSAPFDAVLLVSFGGPQGLDDIRPFLANVLRGRRIPPQRIEEVAHHYELFGGVSPLTAYTMAQAEGLRTQLRGRGLDLPVYVGMRNWTPLLPDVIARMAGDGIRRAIGVTSAAHRSYSSCTQYKQNVLQARESVHAAGLPPVDVTYVGDWHLHDGFLTAVADHVVVARDTLPAHLQAGARLVFTAHSVPATMTGATTYRKQLEVSAAEVARRLGMDDWALVFQSRSGRPEDPWLEPDVNDYLRAEHARGGLDAVILSPIGFVCDHIEVLYDLDHEARATCEELGLPMARASAVNAHPAFIGTLAEMVIRTWETYKGGRPLMLVNPDKPNATELPPPAVSPVR